MQDHGFESVEERLDTHVSEDKAIKGLRSHSNNVQHPMLDIATLDVAAVLLLMCCCHGTVRRCVSCPVLEQHVHKIKDLSKSALNLSV